MAAARLANLEDLASQSAWDSLEQYLGVALRKRLGEAAQHLRREADALQTALAEARTPEQLERVRRRVVAFRSHYLRTETALDFYADAVGTRTSPGTAALLRACDALAYRSMAQVLDPLGLPTPLVLTYIDRGLGASILKAGLRLWDQRTESPAAAIKIVRHNLLRPTALIHESGHQVAHLCGWNDELAGALEAGLAPPAIAAVWAGWASEIAADAFAFAHTGYAAVASLHDVLAGDEAFVFQYLPDDPHPMNYVRVLLGVEMCRRFFGRGPWDELAASWAHGHPLHRAAPGVQALVHASLPLLPAVVELSLCTPMQAFGGRPLAALVNPERVRPEALARLEAELGPALYSSMHWVWTEALRLLALTGYQAATAPEASEDALKRQESWMLRLGTSLRAA